MIKKKRWHCLPGQPLTELDKQVMFWENKGKLVQMTNTPADKIAVPFKVAVLTAGGTEDFGVGHGNRGFFCYN